MSKNKVTNIDYKIFSITENEKCRCVKILGITVYEERGNRLLRIQKICGNLIFTKRLRGLTRDRKVFKFLNFSIAERIIANDAIQYYFFKHPIKKINLPDLFYKKYLKNITSDYDDVYILHANSGEAYLFFAYCVHSVLKKNNSKKPLFIATQKYHVDILKMYLPNANVVLLKKFHLRTKSDKWFVNGHNCFMIFSSNHLYNVEIDTLRNEIGQVHYLDSINKTLNITKDDHTKPIATISDDVKQSLKDKISTLNLNLNKFVILATEAKTCEELPKSFWEIVVKELKTRNYDIFLNIVGEESFIEGCKTTFLSYQEIFELAKKAKAIISLRSGFTEFLIPTNVPSITIYTKFKNRKKLSFSVAKTISAFSIHKFPFVNHESICELNIDDFENEQQLISTIIKNFDSRVIKEEEKI